MKRLTIVDIRNRLRFRLEGAEDLSTRDRYERLAEYAINSGYPSQIVTVLEYGIINNDRLSLDTMCCLFDALSECGTESQIRKYGNIILKEYVSKVRDAKETQTYLKHKLGNAKSKLTTKVQNNFDDIKDSFNKMIQGAQGNFKSNVASMKKTADKVFPNSPLKKKEEKEKAKKEAAWIEAYENMLEEATKLVSIDRILENYNRISKRFNIDRIIQENTVINGVVDTVIELCNLIDTYDMPVKARYNTCLETCWYGFHKNSFEFNESELVTTVTDYYMAHGKNGKACAGILEASTVFDKDDYMGDIEVLTEEEPEDEALQEGIKDFLPGSHKTPDKSKIQQFSKIANSEAKRLYDEFVKYVNSVKNKPDYKGGMSAISITPPKTLSQGEQTDKGYIFVYPVLTVDTNKISDAEWNRPENNKGRHISQRVAEDIPTEFMEIVERSKLHCRSEEEEIGKNAWQYSMVIRFDRKFIKESAIFHEIEFKNDKGEEVPKKCPKCGSKVGVFLRGEPVFLCSNKECEKYFGTVPFKEAKLSSADRAKIKDSDYGIPSKRKYPMPDESHVRSAIQMFNHVDKEDEAELAKNIKKKIKKYGMSVDVGKDNRFSKYYEAAEETGTIRSEIREAVTGGTGYTYFSEDVDFNKILNDFKASNDDKKESKLKALVTKLYSKDVENVVEGTPNLLSYIRTIFILGTFAIPVVGPIVGIITFIADRFIALHMDRKNTEKMRQAFQAEIRATNKKLESTTNEETKGRLEEYKKALMDAYEKIDKYYEDLLSDEELDKKYDEDDDSDIKGGAFGDFGDDFGDDFDFDDDEDFDFNDMEDFEEAVRFIPLTLKIAESFDMTCPVKQFDQEKCHKMLNTAPSLVKDLGDVSIQFPNIIDPDELRRAIDDTKSDAQIGNVKINMVERYDMQNMYKDLSNTTIKESKASDIFTEARSLAVQTEIVRALNEVYSSCVYYSPLTEASFTNSLKLASEKIKKAFTKMSDKEKEISKNIDVSVNNVKKSAERALEADNREAVIKGSVLPSASKLIKLTIVNAALGILINPAVAVINTLGYLAISKATKEKQRRAILDEIEIELKMCNKYIDLAESKNDLKALKKLYTIQRNLERQRAKIKFNLQVKGEKYHDPGDFDQHGIEH